MNSYDENLVDSRFLKKLTSDCPELYNGALKHKWTICVPRSGTYTDVELNAFTFCSHVLIEVNTDDDEVSLFKTANNKMVALDLCTHGTGEQAGRMCVTEVEHDRSMYQNDSCSEESRDKQDEVDDEPARRRELQHVMVLFEETIVSPSNQCIRVLCLERPLNFKAVGPQSQTSSPERDRNKDSEVELDSFENAFDYLLSVDAFVHAKLAVDSLVNTLAHNISSAACQQYITNAENGLNWLVHEIRTSYEKAVTIVSDAATKLKQSRPRVQYSVAMLTSPLGESRYVVESVDSKWQAKESEPRMLDERLLRNAIEIYVMFAVYRPTIRFLGSLTAQEDARLNRLTRRFATLRLEHVASETRSELDAFAAQLPAARIGLLRIANAFTALLKVSCIKQALVALSTKPRFSEPPGRDETPSAKAQAAAESDDARNKVDSQKLMTTDQLLPLITYLVVKSDVPNWHAHMAFMKRLSLARDAPRYDENDYCLTTLEAALHFLLCSDSDTSDVQRGLLFVDPLELAFQSGHRHRSSTSNSESVSLSLEDDSRRVPSRSNSLLSDSEHASESRVPELFRAVKDFDASKIEAMLTGSDCTSLEVEDEPKSPTIGHKAEQDESLREAALLSGLCHPLCDCEKCSAVHKELAAAKMKRERAEETRRLRAAATRVRVHVDAHDDRGFGMTALHVAAYYGQADSADLLIRRFSADVNSVDLRGCTPLHVACQRDNQQICLLLLYHGADPNKSDFEGNIALHYCALYNNKSCLKALLNNCAMATRPRSEQLRPSSYANDQLSPASTRLLSRVSSGASISQFDAVQTSSANGHLHLLSPQPSASKTGLRIDAVNDAGDSVLHVCARWSYETACRLLLDRLDVPHLALFELRNRRKLSPADCASTSTILTLLNDTEQTLKNKASEQLLKQAAQKPKRSAVFAASRSKTHVDSATNGLLKSSRKVSLDTGLHYRAISVAHKPFVQPSRAAKHSVGQLHSVRKQQSLQLHSPPPETPTPIAVVNTGKNIPARRERQLSQDELPDALVKELSGKLLRAAADGDIPLVKYYLECGGSADEQEVLALLNATRSSKIDLATFTQTPLESFMCHPLCQCDMCANLHNLNTKRQTRVNVNSANADGFTCLHVAAIHGREELARFLLSRAADLQAVTKKNRCTALHLACAYNQSKIVRLLQENNADLNACDAHGNTPLHYCAIRGSFDCAEQLLRATIAINCSNSLRNTPLHEAVRRNQTSVALLLMQNGADASLSNLERLNAVQLAQTDEMRSVLTGCTLSNADSRACHPQGPEFAEAALETRAWSPETRALLDTYVNVAQVVDDLHDAERIIVGMSDTIEVIAQCALAESQRAASELDADESTTATATAASNSNSNSNVNGTPIRKPKSSNSDLVASQYRLLFDAAANFTPLHSE